MSAGRESKQGGWYEQQQLVDRPATCRRAERVHRAGAGPITAGEGAEGGRQKGDDRHASPSGKSAPAWKQPGLYKRTPA